MITVSTDASHKFQVASATIEKQLSIAKDLLRGLLTILGAEKQKVAITELDITPVIVVHPELSLVNYYNCRYDETSSKAVGALCDLDNLLSRLRTKAQLEILRFRVFDRPEHDPANWPGTVDDEGLGPNPFSFENECLHLLGRDYFGPEQEELIWTTFLANEEEFSPWLEIQALHNLYTDSRFSAGPGKYHNYSPDLHPSYRAKLLPRIRELAVSQDFRIVIPGDGDIREPTRIAAEAVIVARLNDGEVYCSLPKDKQVELWRAIIDWNSYCTELRYIDNPKLVATMPEEVRPGALGVICEVLNLAVARDYAPASQHYSTIPLLAKKQRDVRQYLAYEQGKALRALADLYPELKDHEAYKRFVR